MWAGTGIVRGRRAVAYLGIDKRDPPRRSHDLRPDALGLESCRPTPEPLTTRLTTDTCPGALGVAAMWTFRAHL